MKSVFLAIFTVFTFAAQAAVDEAPAAETKTAVTEQALVQDRFEFRIEPHWIAVREEIAIDFQIRMNDKFSIGPTFARIDGAEGVIASGESDGSFFSDYTTERLKYGFRAVYYFSGIDRSSVFTSLVANRSEVKVKNTDYYWIDFGGNGDVTAEGEFEEDQVALAVGFRWKLADINFNAGGGIAYYNTPDKIDLTLSDGGTSEYDLDDERTGLFLDAGVGISF